MAPDVSKPGTGINIFIDDDPPITGARIKVIGIGGGGGNAVNRMIRCDFPPPSPGGFIRPLKLFTYD